MQAPIIRLTKAGFVVKINILRQDCNFLILIGQNISTKTVDIIFKKCDIQLQRE
jgi:hypothetical protein